MNENQFNTIILAVIAIMLLVLLWVKIPTTKNNKTCDNLLEYCIVNKVPTNCSKLYGVCVTNHPNTIVLQCNQTYPIVAEAYGSNMTEDEVIERLGCWAMSYSYMDNNGIIHWVSGCDKE